MFQIKRIISMRKPVSVVSEQLYWQKWNHKMCYQSHYIRTIFHKSRTWIIVVGVMRVEIIVWRIVWSWLVIGWWLVTWQVAQLWLVNSFTIDTCSSISRVFVGFEMCWLLKNTIFNFKLKKKPSAQQTYEIACKAKYLKICFYLV